LKSNKDKDAGDDKKKDKNDKKPEKQVGEA